MRRWSGKIATVAGYAPQPPAPYMERYHNPNPSTPSTLDPQRGTRLSSQRWKRSRTVRVTRQMRQRRSRWGQGRPNGKNILLGLFISFVAILVIIFSTGIFYGYKDYLSQLPQVDSLAHQTSPQTTRIYDRNGILLGYAQPPNPSTPVTYNDIPQVMQNAMIAAEDPTFWNNNGIDPEGILRAGVQDASGAFNSGRQYHHPAGY